MHHLSFFVFLSAARFASSWTHSLGRLGGGSYGGHPLPSTSFRPQFSIRLNAENTMFADGWEDTDEMENDSEVEGENRLSDEDLKATLTAWDNRIAQFNTVHLTGRVGNEPEPRYFDDGKVVVNLSLASRRKYHYLERKARDIKSGDEETDWYGLELWGQTAEYVSKYVDKGSRVGVIGTLQIDEWKDKETGEPRSRAKVIVREFDLLETKAEADLRRQNRRGPSFFSSSNDSFDEYNPSAGSSGGFFDS